MAEENVFAPAPTRLVSPIHVTRDDFLLSNLKFVPKGKKDEVFGKPIPQELITKAIQNLDYYKKYLEMAARKPITKEGGKKKRTSKADKPTKPVPAKQPTLTKQTKPMKEKASKPTPSKKIRKGKVMKVHKGKRTDHLVDDENEEPQTTSKIMRRIPVTQDVSTRPSAQPQDDTSINVVRDTPSPTDAETGADTVKLNSEDKITIELDEGQAGSDPGKRPEFRPPLEEDQAGSNPVQRHMFKSGSYRSHPKHTTLYEAPEVSMDHENREELNEDMATSRKRCSDDQDPPPPPLKDFDRTKKKKHDSNASALKQHQVQKSSA
nr:hypothetical protein [Tanacetum cinerariifolium]